MADAKISDLAATTSLADTDEIEVASSGTSKKITGANLRADLVGSIPTDYVAKATYDANTILKADTDNTPTALTMGASTILARLAAGSIVAATPSELRTLLALVVGTNVQAWDADLDAIAALTSAADKMPYSTAAQTWAMATLTAAGRALIDDADASAQRTTLGLARSQRRRDYHEARGLITENYESSGAIANATVATQDVYGGGVYLYAGEVITNIIVCVTNAGSGTAPTGIYLGLWYDNAGTPTCLAATSNLGSDARWTTTGYKVCALSAPYTILSDGIYYLAMLQNGAFGSTAMQIVRNVNSLASAVAQIGSNPRANGRLGTGKTSMAASDTGTWSAAGGYWFGCS